MNQQLCELYNERWNALECAFQQRHRIDQSNGSPANPLVLNIDEDSYSSSDLRVVFFGQETNGWAGRQGKTIQELQNEYRRFYVGGECWSYGGQFWNGVKRFKQALKETFPNVDSSFVWNNVVKIGRENTKGFPPKDIYDIQRKHFNVVEEELNILRPNLVLFLSGPTYDSVLNDIFGNIEFAPIANFSTRQLSRIWLKQGLLAYRTYHPNYLWRKGIGVYFDAIANDAKNEIRKSQ